MNLNSQVGITMDKSVVITVVVFVTVASVSIILTLR